MDSSNLERPGSAPLTPEEVNKKMAAASLPTIPSDPVERKALKAHRATVLHRGMINESLRVDNLPDHLYLEWGPNDPMYIKDMEDKGFIIDDQYVGDRMRVSSGKIPDVLPFVTTLENKKLWDEVISDENTRKHGKSGTGDDQIEEREYKSNSTLPIINESSERILNHQELSQVLEAHIREKQGEI